MPRKRDLIRRIPLLGNVARRLDALEAENRRLRRYLWQSTTEQVAALRDPSSDGRWPIPPALLRDLVAGTDDLAWFLHSGRDGAQTVLDALRRSGFEPGRLARVLDFGCGCGRVLRHLPELMSAELHGTDRNPVAIEWCRRHLAFARFELSGAEPPLAYEGGAFDAIYAFSVFTHLTLETQRAWMQEMRRLLKPAGYLLLSVHGDAYRGRLPPKPRIDYERGQAVVLEEGAQGSNLFNAFHPERYMRGSFAQGFRVAEFVPVGARGNPRQDLYVLQPEQG